jgi:hypothetical protein
MRYKPYVFMYICFIEKPLFPDLKKSPYPFRSKHRILDEKIEKKKEKGMVFT